MSEQSVPTTGPTVESVAAAHSAFSWAFRGQHKPARIALQQLSDLDVITFSGAVAAIRVLVDHELAARANRRMAEVDDLHRLAEVAQVPQTGEANDRPESKVWGCPYVGCGYHIADGPVPDGEPPTHDLIAEHIEDHRVRGECAPGCTGNYPDCPRA